MKDVIWFRHDSNSRRDPDIVKVRAKFGIEGFGIYWAPMETLRESDTGRKPLDDLSSWAYDMHIEPERVEAVVQYCVSIGLLKQADGAIWSERMLREIENCRERSKSASDAAKRRHGIPTSPAEVPQSAPITPILRAHSERTATAEQPQYLPQHHPPHLSHHTTPPQWPPAPPSSFPPTPTR